MQLQVARIYNHFPVGLSIVVASVSESVRVCVCVFWIAIAITDKASKLYYEL